jgi:hypothetical protein
MPRGPPGPPGPGPPPGGGPPAPGPPGGGPPGGGPSGGGPPAPGPGPPAGPPGPPAICRPIERQREQFVMNVFLAGVNSSGPGSDSAVTAGPPPGIAPGPAPGIPGEPPGVAGGAVEGAGLGAGVPASQPERANHVAHPAPKRRTAGVMDRRFISHSVSSDEKKSRIISDRKMNERWWAQPTYDCRNSTLWTPSIWFNSATRPGMVALGFSRAKYVTSSADP